ncbi:hypothetical protein QCA50_019392 [Cerrena zonata]|uniref:Uncharacterized protein n=1 Tax=Cerrena zonata TaxID=2478898 RepID=A0AAW0FJR9_9APHY
MTERKRVRVTDGHHSANVTADGLKQVKLLQCIASYPFAQQESPYQNPTPQAYLTHNRVLQLDIIVPFSPDLRDKYAGLVPRYYSQRNTLSKFVEFAISHFEKYSALSKLLALGQSSSDTDDVWCLDYRGVLTLTVGKETYEELGLTGKPLSWKECRDKHVVHIYLSESAPNNDEAKAQGWHSLGAKQKGFLKSWDQRRGLWDIRMTFDQEITPSNNELSLQEMTPIVRQMNNTKIPQFNLEYASQQSNTDDERSDWNEEVQAYFEWVGMACMGSERLQNEDDVDPYLAVYDPPLSFRVGDLLHVRWTGLLHPTFINRALDLSLESPYAALVGQSVATSPVTYISPPPLSQSQPRAPREDSEDTWALLFSHTNNSNNSSDVRWVLAESIGQWDARWG